MSGNCVRRHVLTEGDALVEGCLDDSMLCVLTPHPVYSLSVLGYKDTIRVNTCGGGSAGALLESLGAFSFETPVGDGDTEDDAD